MSIEFIISVKKYVDCKGYFKSKPINELFQLGRVGYMDNNKSLFLLEC